MKKYFLLICLCVVCCLNNQSYGQDIIKTKTGEEIKARVLRVTRKGASYKPYDDPEFSTYTLSYKELSSIQREGESKPMLFNHKLPRAYFGLSIGPPGLARPLGSFAKNDYDDVKAEPGFAIEGTNVKLDAAFYLWKGLGLTIGTGYTFYKFDYDSYREMYFGGDNFQGVNGVSSNVDFRDNSSDTTGTSDKKFNDNKWTFAQVMVGPIYSFKIGRRITQDFKARVGFIQTRKPSVFLSYHYTSSVPANSVHATYFYSDSEKVDFSYSFGTGTRVALTNRIALFLAADFVHTSPTMTIKTEQFVNGTASNPSANIQYEISSLNLSLGFAYQFKRKKNKFE